MISMRSFPGAHVTWSGSTQVCTDGSGTQVWRVREEGGGGGGGGGGRNKNI